VAVPASALKTVDRIALQADVSLYATRDFATVTALLETDVKPISETALPTAAPAVWFVRGTSLVMASAMKAPAVWNARPCRETAMDQSAAAARPSSRMIH
jgi:hypothetical protein